MIDKIIKYHNSIIFLNGELPDFENYKTLIKNKKLIAADGAATKLVKNPYLKLDYVIGDIDSFIKDNNDIDDANIIQKNNQNNTDFEKCMDFALEKKLFPSLVLGISGGEIDHTINNIFSICNHALPGTLFLEFNSDKAKLGKILYNENFRINLPLKSKISLIPHPHALVTTKGLEWELNQCNLKSNGLVGARNWNTSETVEIQVIKGKILLITDFIL